MDADLSENLTGNDKILADAKKRLEKCIEYNSAWIAQAKQDIEFASGNMWPKHTLDARGRDGRPTLTIDRINPIRHKIQNEFRQNRPMGQVSGKDTESSAKTANVIEGMLRSIANESPTDTALDTAVKYQLICGKGYLRIETDYEDEESFDQVIKIDSVEDPLSVLFPEWCCKTLDFSDAPYAFVQYKMEKEDFKEQYGHEAGKDWSFQEAADWGSQNEVILVEYFVVEKKKKTICKLPDGRVVDKKDVPEVIEISKDDTRETEENTVCWYLLSANKVLEEKEWIGKHIPIIPVLNEDLMVNGKKVYGSLIKSMREPQVQYNWVVSAQVERIALNPISPWIGAEGQFETHEDAWAQSNKKHVPYLEYRLLDHNGQAVPPPMRTPITAPDPGLSEMALEAGENIKATSGVYDASLTLAGKETSGVAIDARQGQSDQTNFHIYDNLCKAVTAMYRQILDIIPKVFDTTRMVRILGDDDSEDIAYVNAHYAQINPNTNGEAYDLSAGKYDVIVKTGPSFATKKEKTANLLTQLVQHNPPLAGNIGDLIAKMLDAPQEVVDRMRMLLPPQLQAPSKDGNPQDKAMIQRLDGIVAKQHQEILQLEAALKSKMLPEQEKTKREVMKGQFEIKKALIENAHEMNLEQHRAAHDLGMQAHGHHLKTAAGADRASMNNQPGTAPAKQGSGV